MATLSEKIGYALGDAAAGGITWKIMSIAFPVFFTSIFGLTVADTALLMLIARMFDVVTDPLMGSLADRTQSRWGTYRPWIIFGAIPLGLVFALLLYTPDFGPAGKRVWAYSFYLLMMAVYTAVNVPYGSLLGVMTQDDDEKNQFSSFRMVGAYAMGFVTLLSFPYILEFIGGEKVPGSNEYTIEAQQHQYALIGVIFGIIAALGTLACGLMTKERIKPVRAEKFSFRQFGDLVPQPALGLSDPHRYLHQLLQRLPLCRCGLYVHLLSGRRRECHQFALHPDYQLHGVHDLRRSYLYDLRRCFSLVHT